MKWICISTGLEPGQTRARGQITPGKIYIESKTMNIKDNKGESLILIKDDTGVFNFYSRNCFITLEQLRDQKLGGIGI